MVFSIVKGNEFLAVRHSVLNCHDWDVCDLVEDTLKLGKYTPGRVVVPCAEGDLVQVQETGEIVLTHQDFLPLHKGKFKDLRERGLAVSLREVLDKVVDYRQKNADQRFVLCLEPKAITNRGTIRETIALLHEAGLNDVYFDSFFAGNLDAIQEVNEEKSTHYERSLHPWASLGRVPFTVNRPKKGYDIISCSHVMSFCDLQEPLIYGAVGTSGILEKIAERPEVRGGYIRFHEGGAGPLGALVKLFNSVSNTETLRRK